MSSSPTPDELASVERFGRLARTIDADYDRQAPPGYLFRTRAAAAACILGTGPGRVLDAGMGPGALLRELERAGWTAWGIDASAQMVELARARLPEATDRLSVGRIEALPYPQHSFEAVTALGVLEYVETERALRELARVLVPGGIAVVSFRRRGLPQVWRTRVVRPAARWWQRATGGSPPVRRRPLARRDALERLFGDAGLAIEGIEPVVCTVLPYPIERAVPNLEHALARRAEEQPRLRFVLGLQNLVVARAADSAAHTAHP